MTEIPEDIRIAAQHAATDMYGKLSWDWKPIAAAILAERKRCSDAASHFTGSLWSSRDNEIAAMIMMEINGVKK